jgi:multiple sugar transport system substrate-binding protein
MMRRTIGLGLALLAAGLVLAGLMLAAQTPVAAGLSDPVTIVYWHQHGADRQAWLDQFVDEFNRTNPYNITVQAEYAGSYSEIWDRVMLGLQDKGPLPNVVPGYPGQFADYARYGAVRFLDDYFDDPALGVTDPGDFYPGLLDNYRLVQYGDQLAGLQPGVSIEGMYYNADLLAAVGLPVPATWDQFETACISITTETISGTLAGTDASRFATWLWSRGGELLSADARRARFQEQPGIDSLRLFQQLFEGGYGRPPLLPYEELNLFGQGKVAFVFGSSAGMDYYGQAMAAGAQQAWGIARVPAEPGHEVVDTYGAAVGVLRESEDADRAAWLFIRWLVEREQTARWAAQTGYFPVRLSAATHPSMTQKLADDSVYAQAFALLPLGRAEPAIRGYEEMRRIIGQAVQDVFLGMAEITGTLQAAALEVDALLAETGPRSQVVEPGGGTLVYTQTEGLLATVGFSAGAVPVTTTVSYVPLDDLPTDGLAFALVPNLTFSQPVTITLHYRDSDVAGMDEEALLLYLYDWTRGTWLDADPCGGYARDIENNILEAGVCHFSDYGLLDWPSKVYLPLIVGE